MFIGKLDRRITIQSYTTAKNDYGEDIRTWSDYLTIWAGINFKRGNEVFEADQLTAVNEVKFVIRYNSNINETMRIVYESNNYDITFIEEFTDSSRKRYMFLTAHKKN